MSTCMIVKAAYGTHPSTGKFYEMLLVSNPEGNQFLVRRYGKAELVRRGGQVMTTHGVLHEFNDLLYQKNKKGYGMQVGAVAAGSTLANHTGRKELRKRNHRPGKIVPATP